MWRSDDTLDVKQCVMRFTIHQGTQRRARDEREREICMRMQCAVEYATFISGPGSCGGGGGGGVVIINYILQVVLCVTHPAGLCYFCNKDAQERVPSSSAAMWRWTTLNSTLVTVISYQRLSNIHSICLHPSHCCLFGSVLLYCIWFVVISALRTNKSKAWNSIKQWGFSIRLASTYCK